MIDFPVGNLYNYYIMNTFRKICFGLIKYLTGFFVLGIILLDVIRDKRIDYLYKNLSVIPNWIVFAIFLWLVAFIYVKRKPDLSRETEGEKINYGYKGIIAASVGLLFIQIIVSSKIYLETGWDCGTLTDMAKSIALQGGRVGNDTYFSQHSNNMLLVAIQSLILKIPNLLGFRGETASYFPMVFVSTLLVNASGFFLWDFCMLISENKRRAWISWGVFAVWIALCPWICIPYSDTYSILFPILILWFYTKYIKGESRILVYIIKWAGLMLITTIGYFIKPTVLLALISVFVVEALEKLCKQHTSVIGRLGYIGLALAGCLGGFLIGNLINVGAKAAIGCELEKNLDYGVAHFFYMGTNYDTCGTYDQADVNFTGSFDNADDRNAADWNAAFTRINDMGERKFLVHLERKALVNFNDGTFSWGNEGAFYKGLRDSDGKLCDMIRNFYYDPNVTSYSSKFMNYTWFHTIAQTIWMAVLCIMVLGLFGKDVKENPATYAARLSILAIFMFVMAFEARARYIYLYAPVIVAVTFGTCHMPRLKFLKSDKA